MLQLLAAIGAIAGLVVSFILGFVALAVIAGVVLVGMVVVGIRVAWLRRRWSRYEQEARAKQAPPGGETLDAEFEVISRDQGKHL